MRFNGDTASNYAWKHGNFNATSTTGGSISDSATSLFCGTLAAATAPANNPGVVTIVIPNYAATVWDKQFLSDDYDRFSTSGGQARRFYGGNWSSTAAITQVTLLLSSGNFADETVAILYGVN